MRKSCKRCGFPDSKAVYGENDSDHRSIEDCVSFLGDKVSSQAEDIKDLQKRLDNLVRNHSLKDSDCY